MPNKKTENILKTLSECEQKCTDCSIKVKCRKLRHALASSLKLAEETSKQLSEARKVDIYDRGNPILKIQTKEEILFPTELLDAINKKNDNTAATLFVECVEQAYVNIIGAELSNVVMRLGKALYPDFHEKEMEKLNKEQSKKEKKKLEESLKKLVKHLKSNGYSDAETIASIKNFRDWHQSRLH